MQKNNNIWNLFSQFLINVNLIVSVLLICLHLLNKNYKWFSPKVFCIRTIFAIFVFNLLFLTSYILFVTIKIFRYGK
ncbi:hypothetical protein GvMRE_I2g286 [endosymbiont GvMRE of Glomus versiforme]|nr:hypothetical protein GvMRE_I2g286 [endosymbiont GvMRE of Glomus versiforme]